MLAAMRESMPRDTPCLLPGSSLHRRGPGELGVGEVAVVPANWARRKSAVPAQEGGAALSQRYGTID